MSGYKKIFHEEATEKYFKEKFKNSPRFKGINKAHAKELDRSESALESVFNLNQIDSYFLSHLDRLSTFFGLEREGRSDTVFLAAIKGKIHAIVYGGQIDVISGLWKSLTQSERVEVFRVAPAKMRIIAISPKIPKSESDVLVKYMVSSLAGGVGAIFEVSRNRRFFFALEADIFSFDNGFAVDSQANSGGHFSLSL